MAKRSKVTGVAGVAVEAVVAAEPVEAAEQARDSQVTGADLAGLAAREAVPGVAAEGRAALERRERARQAVGELERVVAHHGDARVGQAVVRALRAVVAAL